MPATVVLIGSALVLTACGGDDSDQAAAAAPTAPTAPPASGAPSTPPPPAGGSGAPTITGTPLTSVLFGRQYSFTPTVVDADGDVLTFSITGRPAWATFSTATGRLQGTPTQADVGTYSNIRISVSDGGVTTNSAAFNLQVVATASGSAMLSWLPPTSNGDGTPLNDLAAYRVLFGTTPGNYPNSVTVSNPGLSSFVVEQLTPATWYFVVSAVNSTGMESRLSNVATKTIL